jgi:hypothetical protein
MSQENRALDNIHLVILRRAFIALGAAAFVAGVWLGWLDGDFGTTQPHQLVRIGGWVYVPLALLALAPLAPARWLVPLGAGWILAFLVAGFVLATAGDFQPAWPYSGEALHAHAGVFVSLAGAAVAATGVWWSLGLERSPLAGRGWIAVAGAALLAAAAFPLWSDLRGESDEAAIERSLQAEHPHAEIDVVCRGEKFGGPNCAYRIDQPDGSGEAGMLSESR